ncbi:MAG: pyruvate:ferredoxin (flavodoxin) oxidoreductase [Planctomycetes bacterium]|nr:pyruvate:ferredoxin (flavodoxin) oxidoreductase [Planctomycetota bacterium]MCW8135750.1 pyruvate:ferredoxin (flavodoxin) oxidoreductase [Planctomycetota bacterium]
MSQPAYLMLDGNEAVATVAHRLSEVIAIYPITPASPMGEAADQWSADDRPNLWGRVPRVIEMQSEGGAIAAVHGALQAGALTTTFTASQGLLLMIPNLYKIAGELTPFCLHVAARTVATHALSIFGDHSDVMACRQTGMALLCSGSVQEAQDFAAIAHAATLESRIPFMHFFDGFRTSHEISRIAPLTDDTLRALVSEQHIHEHRGRALTPDRPVLRGTAQNPDTFFQAREAANLWYKSCPGITQQVMQRFAELTGRRYGLFDYVGPAQAKHVVVIMGSGADTVCEAADWLNANGGSVGVLKVRLYRPFDVHAFVKALPKGVQRLAVLDRTKEPGAVGEPLYTDVIAALHEARAESWIDEVPLVVGGRYGLSSKEFTPAMARAVFENLAAARPRSHFTIGINDDVSGLSLDYDPSFDIEPARTVRAVFYGLGSDGTVGSNKNTIKIIGEQPGHYAQAYFVYDSRKAGAITVSHLRFGLQPIRGHYLIRKAGFVGLSHPQFLEQYDVLERADHGATFFVNTECEPGAFWDSLPREVQQQIIEKQLRVFVIDGWKVGSEAGLGRHIGTVMQACFFALSGVMPLDAALPAMKKQIEQSYGKRGAEIVRRNFAAVDLALKRIVEVTVPAQATSMRERPPIVPAHAPDFVQKVTALMMAGRGDDLPVSAFPPDGTWPLGTTQWEKRALAREIPIWNPDLCIQCNKCALVCPHAAIRVKLYDGESVASAPDSFKHTSNRMVAEFKDARYTVQVAPDDCTGCSLCVQACPAKDRSNPRHKAIDMLPVQDHKAREREAFEFFLQLPETDRTRVAADVRSSQLLQPLFEFSSACAGCGETPYLKLLSQLFGDRLLVANATGCSSIYGGNLPTTPWRTNADGRGPAWANSLFEDNAEFGLGLRLGVDALAEHARVLLRRQSAGLPESLVSSLLEARQGSEAEIAAQRERVGLLRAALDTSEPASASLHALADYLVRKSVWIVGGDGWAYDIGFGGLDHVLSGTADVNILVLDTEVYSNTGGQQSKATPLGAAAKFAAAGKEIGKKDLGLLAMSYGHVYVAQIAFGAKDVQTVQALREAESWHGPSLIIANSPCIAHGYDLSRSLDQQRLAVSSGVWPLYRFDPRAGAMGGPPLHLDFSKPRTPVREYMQNEGRFRMVELRDKERYERLLALAQREAERRWSIYSQLAGVKVPAQEDRSE